MPSWARRKPLRNENPTTTTPHSPRIYENPAPFYHIGIMANDLVRDMGLPQDYRPKGLCSSEPMSLKEALGRCIDEIQGTGHVEDFSGRRRSSSIRADQLLHAMLHGDVNQVWTDPRVAQQQQQQQQQQHSATSDGARRKSLSVKAKHFLQRCFSRKTTSEFDVRRS